MQDNTSKSLKINSVLGHDSAQQAYTGEGTTCANEMSLICVMHLVQNRSVDLLTSSPARNNCAVDVLDSGSITLTTEPCSPSVQGK